MNTPRVPRCRFCDAEVHHTFVDLGMSPLCETYLEFDELNAMERFYPLHVRVCSECFLVQLEEYVSAEDIFTEYAYFSSYSDSWVEHARCYVEAMIERFALSADSLVVELASNDGYLLQHFLPHGIPVLGIEPAKNVAVDAEKRGVTTITEFFGVELARELRDAGRTADLIAGNNVYAQVPDLNDFTAGIAILLADEGVVTLEFPHLERLMGENQFDTIYHEHFSYFSLYTTQRIFEHHGLRLFDVEELRSHGGSLRVFGCRKECASHETTARVQELLDRELTGGVNRLESYAAFAEQVKETKRRVLEFLIRARDEGKTVAGYGAPGKGNTLLNYCGIREDLVEYTVDRNPYKHGRFLPGTHIPIFDTDRIAQTKPDYLFILPWNLKKEIVEQTSYISDWGGQHVVPIPTVQVLT
jgi:C-methyltransferase C-terminal domain/Putative zinc binding domain/Methyltransferase domain